MVGYGLLFLGGAINETLGMGLYGIYILGALIPGLAVAVRRLHDSGRSGWWLLIALVPLVGAILLLVWFATDGVRETNKWGSNPKYPSDDISDHLVDSETV